jgi:hypothetical protein
VNSEANIYGAILPAVLMFVTQGPFKNKFSLPVARRSKANAIQQLIGKTDKEIVEMMYELYRLTGEGGSGRRMNFMKRCILI